MNALHSVLQSLKDKHKAFIGNRHEYKFLIKP